MYSSHLLYICAAPVPQDLAVRCILNCRLRLPAYAPRVSLRSSDPVQFLRPCRSLWEAALAGPRLRFSPGRARHFLARPAGGSAPRDLGRFGPFWAVPGAAPPAATGPPSRYGCWGGAQCVSETLSLRSDSGCLAGLQKGYEQVDL